VSTLREPEALLEAVHDRTTFLQFLEALAEERRRDAERERGEPTSAHEPASHGWVNVTAEAFLESAARWAEDVVATEDDRAMAFAEAPSWAAFARLLHAGKAYE
jgi:hypothetical protein